MTTALRPNIDVLPKHGEETISIEWFPTDPEDDKNPAAGMVRMEGKRIPTTIYTVTEFTTSWGRGFFFGKFGGKGAGTDHSTAGYSVLIAGTGASGGDRCECRGAARHGHCKHLEAARQLVANNWL